MARDAAFAIPLVVGLTEVVRDEVVVEVVLDVGVAQAQESLGQHRGDAPAAAGHFHGTQPAAGGRLERRMVAQGGDGDLVCCGEEMVVLSDEEARKYK